MSDTQKDNDFRRLRKAGNGIRSLFDSKRVRARHLTSPDASADAKRIVTTYTKKELWYLAQRRHSASHRKTAMRTRHRVNRLEKHREKRDAMKEHLKED